MEEIVQPVQRPNRLKAALWLAGVVVAFFGASLGAGLVSHALKLSPLAATSVGQVAILVVVVLFALIDGGGFRSLGLVAKWKGIDFAAIPGVMFAHLFGSLAVGIALMLAGQVNPESSQQVTNVLSGFGKFGGVSMLLVPLGLALQAGVGEELLFRGYIITRLERMGLGAWWCIIISALIFGAVHIPGYGWAMALPKAVGLGLAAGAYFWYRRNLLPLIIAHTLIDFLMFMLVVVVAKLGIPL